MRAIRLTVAGLCAAGALATAAPAVADTVPTATTADCHTRFYFNQNSYVYLRANGGSTVMGLAYANDTFIYKNQSQNGFFYGTDGRSGGATGWVRTANIDTNRVCDA